MPHFIKTGYWDCLSTAPKNYLNLEQVIAAAGGGGGGGVISCGEGLSSAQRICSYNRAISNCTTALGYSNIVAMSSSEILGGRNNTIAEGAIGYPTFSEVFNNSFDPITGATTLCRPGDFTSYFSPGSTISGFYPYGAYCNGYGEVSFNNVPITGSSYDVISGYTTICANPSNIPLDPFGSSVRYGIQRTCPTNSGTCSSTYSSYYTNVIVSGMFNTISSDYGSSADIIVGGVGNTASGGYGFIGGGFQNLSCAGFIGLSNRSTASGYGAVITGVDSCASNQSAVVTGYLNVARSSSFVGAGNANQANNSSFVGAGSQNIVSFNASNSAIIGGFNNSISDSSNRGLIGGGTTLAMSFSNYSVMLNGCLSLMCLSNYSSILGGRENRLSCSNNVMIASGICTFANQACNSFTGSAIYSVLCNTLGSFIGSAYVSAICNAPLSFIGAGYNNFILAGCSSSIVSGEQNRVCSVFSSVLGGYCNCTVHPHTFIAGCGITTSMGCAMYTNRLVISNVPTSSAGLPAGAVWSDSGTLKIV